MKKILALGLVLALFTAAASAQHTSNGFRDGRDGRDGREFHQRFDNGQLTRGERSKLRKNDRHYNHAKKYFKRDGRISPMERKKLSKMKRHDRRDAYRFKHNGRRS